MVTRIVILGGGPAGYEAALVAAAEDHDAGHHDPQPSPVTMPAAARRASSPG
ncbi:hypothetical protein JHV675_54290 [Mycobacterium avium subsp. hominissuis]